MRGSVRDPGTFLLSTLTFLLIGSYLVLSVASRVGVFWPVLVTLATRLAYGTAVFATQGVGINDGALYDNRAQALVQYWNGDGPQPSLPIGKEGFPTLLAFLYDIFGHYPELGIIINCLAAAALPIVIALACRALGWPQAESWSAWIVALWPASFFWTPLLLREALVTLVLAIALLGILHLRERRWSGLLLLTASTLVMVPLRGGLAFLIALILPACLVFESMVSRGMSAVGRVLSVVAMAIGVGLALTVVGSLLARANYFDSDTTSTAAVAHDVGTTSFSAAAGGAGEFGGGIGGFIAVAFGPFPWQWTNSGLLVVGVDALLWLGLWSLAILGIRSLRSPMSAIYCWMPTLALFYYLSLGSTNFGLIMRLRTLGLPFIAPLAGLGLAILFQRSRERARNKNRSQHREKVMAREAARPLQLSGK